MRAISNIVFGGALFLSTMCAQAFAGPADIEKAVAERLPDGRYVFVATIRHADVDFAHFADRFEVLSMEGDILATRPLVHPHVDEQPFTRALVPPVTIPSGIKSVKIRAHDKQHGFGGKEVLIQLPGR